MSLDWRILGSQLPRTLRQLLDIPLAGLSAREHENLALRARLGLASGKELFRLGVSHISRYELGLGRQRLLEATDRRSGDPECHLGLAVACEALGLLQLAAEHVDRAILLSAPAQRPSLLAAAGFCHERAASNVAGARYRAACESDSSLFAARRLPAVYLSEGRLSEAAWALRQLLQVAPEDQAFEGMPRSPLSGGGTIRAGAGRI